MVKFKFARLASSPFVLTEHMKSWLASEASEILSGVYKFELMQYVYIYIYMYGGTCAILVAHATYM